MMVAPAKGTLSPTAGQPTPPAPLPGAAGLTPAEELLPQGVRVPYGGISEEELAFLRSRDPYEYVNPQNQETGMRVEDTPGWENLAPIERSLMSGMARVGGVVQAVGDYVRPALDNPVGAALGAIVEGVFKGLDAGAEGVERLFGLAAQYRGARDEGTVDDFWQNLGRNWRAASFYYDVSSSIPTWQERNNTGGFLGYDWGADMPGYTELVKIQGWLDEGRTPDEIRALLAEDMGALYYRGIIADAAGHIFLDPIAGPINVFSAIKPIRSMARWASTGMFRFMLPADLAEAERAVVLARNAAGVAEAARDTSVRRVLEIDNLLETADDPARASLMAERATHLADVASVENHLVTLHQKILNAAEVAEGARAPSALQQRVMHAFGAIPITLGEDPAEAQRLLDVAEEGLRLLETHNANRTEQIADLERQISSATNAADAERLTGELAEARRGFETVRITEVQEDISRFRGIVERGADQAQLLRLFRTPAALWKPWTWFRLRPESVAAELFTRVADGLKVLMTRVRTPGDLLEMASNPRRFLMDPRMGMSIYTLQGRSLVSALRFVEGALGDLVEGYRAFDVERLLLRHLADAAGITTHQLLGMLDAGKQAQLLESLRAAAAADTTLAALLGNQADLTRTLDKMRDLFVSGRVPYDMDTLRLHAIGRVTEAVMRQAIVQFGIQAEGVFTKAANALRAAEGLAFLGLNPGYPMRNFWNNEVTMWARGVWGAMREADIENYWRTMGVVPERLGEGFGAAEMASEQIRRIATADGRRVLQDAVTGSRGAIDRIQGWFAGRRLGRADLRAWASGIEANASRRAFTQAHMQFVSSQWRAGRGFSAASTWIERNFPGASEELGQQFIRRIESGLRDARNPDQIAGTMFRPAQISISQIVDDTARAIGRTPDQVRDILGEPLLRRIQDGLSGAGRDPEAIQRVFGEVSQMVQRHLDELAEVEIESMVDRAASLVTATGDPSGLVHLMGEQADEAYGFASGHIEGLRVRTEAIRALPDAQRPAAWTRFFQENDAYFNRMFGRMQARYDGMIRAANRYGMNIPQEATRPMQDFLEAVRAFHKNKGDLLRRFESGDLDFERLSGLLDQEYARLIRSTRKYGERMDDVLYRVIRSSSRAGMERSARAWRTTVHELREGYMRAVQKHYRELEAVANPDARIAMHNAFTNERMWWMGRIHTAEREGLAMLSDGRAFGSHVQLDNDTVRIFNQQFGSERFFEGGTSGEMERLGRLGYGPDRAQQLVLQEAARRANHLSTRVADRLGDATSAAMERANAILNEAVPQNVPWHSLDTGESVAEVLPRALEQISSPTERVVWLDAVAAETTVPEVRRAVMQQLADAWRDMPVSEFSGPNSPLRRGRYVIVSPERAAFYETLPEAERARQAATDIRAMRDALEEMGYRPIEGLGNYGAEEFSFLIPGMTDVEGYELAQRFGQQSVLVSGQGLVYPGPVGQMHRANFDNITFDPNLTEFYTEVTIGGQRIRFSIDVGDTTRGMELWRADLDGPNGIVDLYRWSPPGRQLLDPTDVRSLTRYPGVEGRRLMQDPEAVRRLHYYISGTPGEREISTGMETYRVRVSADRIYDLGQDTRQFMRAAGGDINEAERALREAGYWGYRMPERPNTIAIFEPLRPYDHGAEAAEAAVRQQATDLVQSYAPGRSFAGRTYNGQMFRDDLVRNAGLAEDRAELLTQLTETWARSWATRASRTPEEWWATHLAGLDAAPDDLRAALRTLRSEPSAMVEFMEDGRAVILAFSKNDFEAMVHEIGHVFRRDLGPDEMNVLTDWLGLRRGQWTRQADERFAHTFVRYLMDGTAPVQELKPVFEQFRDWLVATYQTIRRAVLRTEISPEVRSMLDRMLRPDLPAQEAHQVTNGISVERFMQMVPDETPMARGLDDLWWTDGRRFAAQMESSAMEQAGRRVAQPEVSEYAQRALRGYADHVEGQWRDTQLAAMRFAEIKRDSALLNYHRRTYFDFALGHLAPFAFWTTHSAWNWFLWSFDKPQILADFYRLRNLQRNAFGSQMPARFQNMVRTPLASLPFIPDYLGPIYMNPVAIGLPFDYWMQPFDQMEYDARNLGRQTERILIQRLESGDITREQYDTAIQAQDQLYQEAMAQARQAAGDQTDAFDIFQQLIAPHAPIQWAYNVARGTPERIGPFLPITRTVRSLTAILGWPGGGFNLESGLRSAIGLPSGDQWDDYRAERMVANMIAMGEVSVQAGRTAMSEHSGPIWDEAVQRAAREQAVTTIGSMFGIPLRAYPPGEEEGRRLVEMMHDAYQREEGGETGAVDRFWEEHPEVAGRLALYQEPAERLQSFLVDEIWDRWNGFTGLQRRAVTEVLGQDFEDHFLSRETRNTEAIPAEVLGTWLRLMGGDPPGTLGAGVMPIAMPPEAISNRAEVFYQERRARYGEAIYQVQDQYFQLEEGPARRQFLTQHPELRDYWRWRTDWLLRNPDVVPYLVENEENRPQYPSVRALEEAYANQPSFTWEEWFLVLPPETFILVSNNLRTGAPMTGPVLDELRLIADSMGTDVGQLLDNIRAAYAAQQ